MLLRSSSGVCGNSTTATAKLIFNQLSIYHHVNRVRLCLVFVANERKPDRKLISCEFYYHLLCVGPRLTRINSAALSFLKFQHWTNNNFYLSSYVVLLVVFNFSLKDLFVSTKSSVIFFYIEKCTRNNYEHSRWRLRQMALSAARPYKPLLLHEIAYPWLQWPDRKLVNIAKVKAKIQNILIHSSYLP